MTSGHLVGVAAAPGSVLVARWIGIVSAGGRVITWRVITWPVISTGGSSTEGSSTDGPGPRAGATGHASQQSTLRTQCRKCVSQALERVRQVRRHSHKVGAVCGNSARTDLGGGRSVMTVPTALRIELFRFWTQNGHGPNWSVDGIARPATSFISSKTMLKWFRLQI